MDWIEKEGLPGKMLKKKLSENIARNLLRDNQDVDYVHRMTGLSVFRIRELKANL